MKLPTTSHSSSSNGSGPLSGAIGIGSLKACSAAGFYVVISLLTQYLFSVSSLSFCTLLCASCYSFLQYRTFFIVKNFDTRFWIRCCFAGLLFYLQWDFFLYGLQILGSFRTLIFSESLLFLYTTIYCILFKGMPCAGMRARGLIALGVCYFIALTLDEAPLHDASSFEPSYFLGFLPLSPISAGLAYLFLSTLFSLLHRNMIGILSTENLDESKLLLVIIPAATVCSLAPLLFSSFLPAASPAVGELAAVSSSFMEAILTFFTQVLSCIFISFALLAAPRLIQGYVSTGRVSVLLASYASLIAAILVLLILDVRYEVPTVSSLTILEFALLLVGLHWLIKADSPEQRLLDPKKADNLLPTFADGSGYGLLSEQLGFFAAVRSFLQQILANPDSRSIFTFLFINLMFMFVEMAYGYWTNSLGLISDAFHMLTDCSALAIGLYASVISKWDPTAGYSYGYARVQSLAGFANAVFLVFISFSVFNEGLARLIDPPTVKPEELFVVSCLGLGVNLIGIFAFSGHGHVHGGGHGDEEGGHHGHSHGDANMSGVFLHVLADTLGSVGVIISSVLIWAFDWQRSDPITSILLSVLIFVSVIPLLKSSASTLLHKTPSFIVKQLPAILSSIQQIPHIETIQNHHFWRYEGDQLYGSVSVDITPNGDHQEIRAQIISQLIRIIDPRYLTIQIRASKRTVY